MFEPVLYRAKKLNSNEYALGTVMQEPRGNWTMYWLEESSDAVGGLNGKYMNYADIDPETIEIVRPTAKPLIENPPATNTSVLNGVGSCILSNAYIYYCGSCRYRLAVRDKFCPECGVKIDWSD